MAKIVKKPEPYYTVELTHYQFRVVRGLLQNPNPDYVKSDASNRHCKNLFNDFNEVSVTEGTYILILPHYEMEVIMVVIRNPHPNYDLTTLEADLGMTFTDLFTLFVEAPRTNQRIRPDDESEDRWYSDN